MKRGAKGASSSHAASLLGNTGFIGFSSGRIPGSVAVESVRRHTRHHAKLASTSFNTRARCIETCSNRLIDSLRACFFTGAGSAPAPCLQEGQQEGLDHQAQGLVRALGMLRLDRC